MKTYLDALGINSWGLSLWIPIMRPTLICSVCMRALDAQISSGTDSGWITQWCLKGRRSSPTPISCIYNCLINNSRATDSHLHLIDPRQVLYKINTSHLCHLNFLFPSSFFSSFLASHHFFPLQLVLFLWYPKYLVPLPWESPQWWVNREQPRMHLLYNSGEYGQLRMYARQIWALNVF